MRNSARIRVWCEDREHEAFARKLLEKFGVNRRGVDINVAPRGRGAACQWVVKQFGSVRGQARATRNQVNLGFLVLVDGDNSGLQARLNQFDEFGERSEGDRVAVLVPCWEIETWVCWLGRGTDDVDETRSYKAEISPELFRELLEAAIAAWDRPRATEEERLPSLSRARDELKRLPL